MTTAELTRSGSGTRHESDPRVGRGSARALLATAIALGAVVVYAVFAHGAIRAPAEPRIQVAVAAIVVLASGAWLWTRSLEFPAARSVRVALGLLVAFAAWTGVSLAWSVAPDLTWLEFNRVLTYALVLGLAIILGASAARAVSAVAYAGLALGLVVVLYALGQKLLPGIHLGDVVNLNQTGGIARLQDPLGYWNALGLLLAMTAPLSLAVAANQELDRRLRLAALVGLQLVFVTIAFTYSRGALIALVAALAICVAGTREWLRALMWSAVAAVAAAPALILGLTSAVLTTNDMSLSRRESAGLLLLLLMVGSSVLLWLAGDRLLDLERTVELDPAARRRIVRGLRSAVGLAALAGILALAVSSRGLFGSVSHVWSSFTSTKGIGVSNPSRLFSADSANRWVWWKEAIGAFSARPLAGWGAGSFPVVDLLYRHDTLTVQHPHSAPLQWLAETGLIGTGLALGAWLLLMRASVKAVRTQTGPGSRLTAAALLAAASAYSLHALYDWDWDIPGITLPALILLGVLVGAGGRSLRQGREPRVPAALPAASGARLLLLAATTACSCIFAASAVLPSLAASEASTALLAASGSSPASLGRAEQAARIAGALDPLSAAGPQAEATIAEHRGQPGVARAALIRALIRWPSDGPAWQELAVIDDQLGLYAQAVTAARHALDLDPLDPAVRTVALGVAQRAELSAAPPAASATAITTP